MAKSDGGDRKKPSALERAIQAAIGDERTVGREDDPAKEKYPRIWEWLTLTTDASKRYLISPGVITITLGPEGVNVSCTLRDLKYSCTSGCLHLQDALDALELAMGTDGPHLRTWGKDEPHLRKRRQKD
jgi:hypothetical protein